MTSPPEAPRMVAEFEPHAATLAAWPTNESDWPGLFHRIPAVTAAMIEALGMHERVVLAVPSEEAGGHALDLLRKARANLDAVALHIVPLDRNWLRDTAPFFVDAGGRIEARVFQFNAWAKYEDWRRDAEYGEAAAAYLGIPCARVEWGGSWPVLEGGAVDTNGQGVILATEECLLSAEQARNPGWDAAAYAACFANCLGADHTVWLGRGIEGDDTHGHVDDFCRFVNPSTLVLCEAPPSDPVNHRQMEENRERLEGEPFHVVRLPMPEPLWIEGVRVPASYANFYIANGTVLVPIFGDPADARALGILGELFPGRRVVGIGAGDLIWGMGAVHCQLHEVPAAPIRAANSRTSSPPPSP